MSSIVKDNHLEFNLRPSFKGIWQNKSHTLTQILGAAVGDQQGTGYLPDAE